MHVAQRVHDVESRISHFACVRAFAQKVCGSGIGRGDAQAVFETGAFWSHRGRGNRDVVGGCSSPNFGGLLNRAMAPSDTVS